MTNQIIKHIKNTTVINLEDQVSYLPGQIVSKTLTQNKAISLTLFAFSKEEEISSHDSNGDAMITVLDGVGEITIGEEVFLVRKGETIVMPAKVPHAVFAKEDFKMFLTVVFP